MTLPTLEMLEINSTYGRTDVRAIFQASGSIFSREFVAMQRAEKPKLSELQYMLGKSLHEAVRDAAYKAHGIRYSLHLPSEQEEAEAVSQALKRAAELQPDYFAQ